MVLTVAFLAAGLAAPVWAGDKDKDAKDPDWLEFAVLKDGKDAGLFGFKTVSTGSGKIFTSAKLEMMTGKKVTLQIQFHVERDPDGTLAKYKKWIGKQQGSADTDLIVFWPYEKKMRIVSKNPKKYKADLTPPKPFYVYDPFGYHFYADLAGLWKSKGAGQYDCLTLDDGKLVKVKLSDGGVAKMKRGEEEVSVAAVKVEGAGPEVTLLVGEKPVFLGFLSKEYVVLRHGFNYLSTDAAGKLEAPGKEEGAGKAEAEDEGKAAVEDKGKDKGKDKAEDKGKDKAEDKGKAKNEPKPEPLPE
jgi:hypothetical protein